MRDSQLQTKQKFSTKQASGKAFYGIGAVVGTIHSPGGGRAAQRLVPGVLTAVEMRLDALPPEICPLLCRELAQAATTRNLPRILTPRCPSEGGLRSWDEQARWQLLSSLLPWADAVDLELAGFSRSRILSPAVQAAGVPLILSLHDYAGTPSAKFLREAQAQAGHFGATVFKVATTLRSPQDLSALLALLDPPPPVPTAAMAMGPLGQAARLFLAVAGSVLNYGWLEQPQVEGQWSAEKLRELFHQVGLS